VKEKSSSSERDELVAKSEWCLMMVRTAEGQQRNRFTGELVNLHRCDIALPSLYSE
jgi:hypothetical protein